MPKYLVIFVASWVIAQGAKYIIEIRKNKNVRFLTAMSESGGMPSSHSAVVIAIATHIALEHSVHSSEFGLAFTFAMIVLYDSMKVRYSVGRQAIAINNIIEAKKINIPKIRVVKGHTPLEVAAGTALGLILGYISFLLFKMIDGSIS